MSTSYTALPPDIPQIFTEIVALTADGMGSIAEEYGYNGVYFFHDTWIKLMERFTEANKVKNTRETKFPAICLVHNYEEVMRRDETYYQVRLDFVIVVPTKNTYFANERFEKNYRPLLHKIYAEFMYHVTKSGYFVGSVKGYYPHTKVDDIHMGNNGDSYKLPDIVDGVYIKGLELNVKEKNLYC